MRDTGRPEPGDEVADEDEPRLYLGERGGRHREQALLVTEAQNIEAVALYPWLLLPLLPVIITVLAFNSMGDGLRDAADLRVRRLSGPAPVSAPGRQL